MKDLDSYTNIHIIGAGGIGLSAAAKLLAKRGARVTASDLAANETTQELAEAGIPVSIGSEASMLPEDAQLVVYSGAVLESDPQRTAARELRLPQWSYFDFIGELSKQYRTIAVSGTNGKSTTTAMLALCLIEAGLDPTVIVGTKVPQFPDKNLRVGGSDLFVVEACEHEANMLKLHPRMIVLTNIEEDHLDFYRDLAHITETFQTYIERLPQDGTLILNADDHVSFEKLRPATPFVTYALESRADYVARRVVAQEGKQTFYFDHDSGSGATHAPVAIWKPGRFNVYNALAAGAAAHELGASPAHIAKALADFRGLWRRFEQVGTWRGAEVISDYGHHPTAIRETLAGVEELYDGRRVILVFQPHQHNRTKRLFHEFVPAFDGADAVVLPAIYDVAGRESAEDKDVTSEVLAAAIRDRDGVHGVTREVVAVPTLDDAVPVLEGLVREGDILLVMGAGDVYRLALALGKEAG